MASLLEVRSRQPWLDAEIGRRPENLIDEIARVAVREMLLHAIRNELNYVFREACVA